MNTKQRSILADEVQDLGDFSLDQLVEDHADYIYSYAFRYFRNIDKAEELVQETFLAATKSIGSFGGQSNPRTWLIGILRHKILDRLRVKQREEALDLRSLEDESMASLFDKTGHWHADNAPLSWGSSAEKLLSQKQFLNVLESCLSKLPERVRQIFLLREVEGKNREEISAEFPLSSSNIGVILHRARINLQQCLNTNWLDK